MHILILGATGRTGKILLAEALKRGHLVNVLVSQRGSLNISHELLKVYEGTPTNQYILADAMKGCEAILSALNISRVSDYPWAKLRTSKTFLSSSMKKVLQTAGEQHIKRIIVTTAWGVAETKKDIPFWFRWLINNSNIRYPYLDHERQEVLLKESDADWTIVRPAALTNSEKEKKIQVSIDNSPKPSLMISRKNVASFMLDALENNLYSLQCPVISEE